MGCPTVWAIFHNHIWSPWWEATPVSRSCAYAPILLETEFKVKMVLFQHRKSNIISDKLKLCGKCLNKWKIENNMSTEIRKTSQIGPTRSRYKNRSLKQRFFCDDKLPKKCHFLPYILPLSHTFKLKPKKRLKKVLFLLFQAWMAACVCVHVCCLGAGKFISASTYISHPSLKMSAHNT
jgi:hypothetical protein